MLTKADIQTYNGNYLIKDSDYLLVPPHDSLKPYISNYTLSYPTVSSMPNDYTVLPSASSTLVFSIVENKLMGGLRGVNTKSTVIGNFANKAKALFLIEFQPYGLSQFTRMNQSELRDGGFDFATINKGLHKKIVEIIESATKVSDLIDQLDVVFLSYIETCKLNPQLILSVKEIISHRGQLTNKALSESVYYSEKHLNRIFQEQIGMNIKTFSRIVRVNHVFRLLNSQKYTMTQIAEIARFHDKSHLTHEFKRICTMTPQDYLENMSIFYNEEFKL